MEGRVMAQLLTHSRLSTFRACPRKHQLRYEIGVVPDKDSEALRIGTAYHAALEANDLGNDPEEAIAALGILDPYEMALCVAMFAVHCERWAGDTLEVVATELAFDLALRNPATGAPTPIWRLAGVIDRIYRLPDGTLAIQDYKTTSEDIAPGSDYWLRLSLDQQMSLYVLAARELGHDVSKILYDVTRRPLQRPAMATPVAERKYTEKPSKLKDGTVRPAGSLYANQRESNETPAEFAARVAECMRVEPDAFFVRHEIARLDRDLKETQSEVWQQQLAIRESQRVGHWWRNPGACVTHYRCPYLPICRREITTEYVPDGYLLLEDVHPELARAGQAAPKQEVLFP